LEAITALTKSSGVVKFLQAGRLYFIDHAVAALENLGWLLPAAVLAAHWIEYVKWSFRRARLAIVALRGLGLDQISLLVLALDLLF